MIFRKILRGKIHRATVTACDVDYEGSITIAEELAKAAGMAEHEAVQVWDITNAARFETYVIYGPTGSGEVVVNGAAAHLVKPGDLIIVAAFHFVSGDEELHTLPNIVMVNAKNQRVPR